MLATFVALQPWNRTSPAVASSTSVGGITTVQALTAPESLEPPAGLLGAGLDQRGAVAASRATERVSLPECSGQISGPGSNGRLRQADLCDLWQAPYQDRADAVVSITALNDDFTARFGEPMCLSSGYRTLEEQAALRAQKGGLAAPAGQSNHGWGLAVDFCPETYAGERGTWLNDVGAVYGWANPDWARRGGSGAYEPWHWEYVPGVEAIAEAGW